MAERPVCKIPDCCKPVEAKGYCSIHYGRLRRTGDPLKVKPHHRFKDVTGVRFGRLTALKIVGKERPSGGSSVWLCRCDCGNETRVPRSKLSAGHTRSCGCLIDEARRAKAKHRMIDTAEYQAWHKMRSRCKNPTDKRYKYYGGRGITVCRRWDDDFLAFLSDVGKRPSTRHSLDRIDVNGHYEPGNVRWATRDVQANNRRCVMQITAFGRTLTAKAWSKETGLSAKLIYARMRSGWSPELALSEPNGANGYATGRRRR